MFGDPEDFDDYEPGDYKSEAYLDRVLERADAERKGES